MADEKKNGSKIVKGGQQCMCGCDGSGAGCACGWHHGHTLFRILLGVIILVIVFWFGVKLGELREIVRGGYNGYGQQMPMMRFYYNGSGGMPFGASGAGASTATPTTTH